MFNTHVTVNSVGHLTPPSTITAPDGTTVAVPALADNGGIRFWPRVDQALRQIGWACAHNTPHATDGGVLRFNAVKV